MKRPERGHDGRARGALLAVVLAGVLLPLVAIEGRAEDRVSDRRAESEVQPRPEAGSGPLPLRSYIDEEGRNCRVYERRVVIDGGPATALATVCRDPSGRWVLSR